MAAAKIGFNIRKPVASCFGMLARIKRVAFSKQVLNFATVNKMEMNKTTQLATATKATAATATEWKIQTHKVQSE